MSLFPLCLLIATFLNALLAGFLFAFAVVVMPGIAKLDAKGFIRAFQVIDGIIQDSQPLFMFMLMWIGSALSLIAVAVLGFWNLAGISRGLLVALAIVHVLGIQLPTMTINIPLNNKLQSVDVEAVDELTLEQAREEFEPRWNRWNVTRTIVSCVLCSVLLVLLWRL